MAYARNWRRWPRNTPEAHRVYYGLTREMLMSVQNTPTAAGATQVQETTGGVYASLFEKINLHPVDALDDIDAWQDSQRLADASADERVTAAVRVFLERLKQSGQQVEKLDKTLLDHHIAELDRQISRQLDTVMHHPEFQQVESLWRGLKHLVDRTDYDHAEPEHTFPRLFDLITELLEASLPSRVIALPMTRLDELTWKTSLHDMRLREEADFYLSVRSDIPAWQIAERFPELCKAGSPDEVNAVSISALNGIPLIPVMRVPAALPVRLENHYFALDMESAAARDMLEQGVCMFYVPSLLGALEIELFAMLRS
ncbi:type VI secretion system baseplate subunit TssK [Cronobacter sakazakii]|uniref:type VI secretion system baseplate subunit TssK n=2 Tax=Cronobacter sakazakii TaxID=28141 RepID=UPI0028949CDF|nr:type VI secretion system baseplate subunit TssK [Cronobacter sakazakii]MDT3547900.1 type VI secretion system baseplate subunit TssK [Cronobacter sakazakii]MDT3633212.1 type VI secretion system baseplate subunit TssK [Cronobacter sakazakii]